MKPARILLPLVFSIFLLPLIKASDPYLMGSSMMMLSSETPPTPPAIYGKSNPCPNSQQVYKVDFNVLAVNHNWTFPAGWTILQYYIRKDSVLVKVGSNPAGTISCISVGADNTTSGTRTKTISASTLTTAIQTDTYITGSTYQMGGETYYELANERTSVGYNINTTLQSWNSSDNVDWLITQALYRTGNQSIQSTYVRNLTGSDQTGFVTTGCLGSNKINETYLILKPPYVSITGTNGIIGGSGTSSSPYVLDAAGGQFSITIKANDIWSVTYPSWLTPINGTSGSSGTVTKNINFSVSPLNPSPERSGQIIFTTETGIQFIKHIKQDKYVFQPTSQTGTYLEKTVNSSTQETLIITGAASTFTIDMEQVNVPGTIGISQSWINGNTLFDDSESDKSFSITANPSASQGRTGNITLTSGSISKTFTLLQNPIPAELELGIPTAYLNQILIEGNEHYVYQGGSGSFSLPVESNLDWSVTSKPNWITISSGSPGSNDGTVVFNYSANDMAEPYRTGIIRLTAGTLVKKIYIAQEPFSLPYSSSATSGKNYIQTIIPQEPFSEISFTSQKDAYKVNESVQYFDGLGRLIQTVNVKASPGGYDVVKPVEYDSFGRQAIEYLPYTLKRILGTTPGEFRNNALTGEQEDFFNNSDRHTYTKSDVNDHLFAFSKAEFDGSPLNRIVRQASPGKIWGLSDDGGSGKCASIDYRINIASEVKLFRVTAGGVKFDGYYGAGTLYVTESFDENNPEKSASKGRTIEYKDMQGNVVLKRSYEGTVAHDTYYVYDNKGLLCYVIPPEGADRLSSDGTTYSDSDYRLMNWCYIYKYDYRNRMVEKKVPGAEVVYMVYDNLDRLRATQDGKMRIDGKWLITKYDLYNRPVMTGFFTSSVGRVTLQNNLHASEPMNEERSTASGNRHNYTNISYPTTLSESDYLTVIYYDNYNDLFTSWTYTNYHISSCQFTSIKAGMFEPQASNSVRGMMTGEKVKNLETGVWYNSKYYYDSKGRSIMEIHQTHTSGTDMINYAYNFTGAVIADVTSHSSVSGMLPASTLNLGKRYVYDHEGRLKKTYLQLAGQEEVLLSALTYDELGQVKEKYLHAQEDGASLTGVQKVDYKYNIRGWLTDINDVNNQGSDKFAMKLYYQNTGTFNNTPQYNGNISAAEWKEYNPSDASYYPCAYTYSYDYLNRLTNADYQASTGANLWSNSSMLYDVEISNYDKQGNIGRIVRRSNGTLIDDITYTYYNASEGSTYKSNKLWRVEDASSKTIGFVDDNIPASADDYNYDPNGNLTVDYNKGINEIAYNYLNLPRTVHFYIGNLTASYTYDAAGTKLSYTTPEGDVTDYFGNFVYENGTLKYIMTGEGKMDYFAGTNEYLYEYFLTDHLGNTRAVIGGDGQMKQATSYYPFGMEMRSYAGSSTNEYLYNGKELQEGTDWYDYGARMYDPSLGRWHVIDPMASEPHNNSLSPYHYTNNNPILYVDINGEDWFLNNQTGQMIFIKGASEIDQTYIDFLNKIGCNLNIDDFDRIGSDDMFDTEDNVISDTKKEFAFMSDETTESFMGSHGYEKLMERTTTEIQFEMDDYEGNGKITTTSYIYSVDYKITYEKDPNALSGFPYLYSSPEEVNQTNYAYAPWNLTSVESGPFYRAYKSTKHEKMRYDASKFKNAPSKRSTTNAGQNTVTSTYLYFFEKTLKKIIK